MWYRDQTAGFCRRDRRRITDGCSLLLGCWNAFFKNMLFKHSSPSESQMAASPTGNIRSFCSEDALGWLIHTSKNKKLCWGFFPFFFSFRSFFFFYPLRACKSKASDVTWGGLVGSPHWKPSSRSEASVMFYWLASFLQFGDNRAAEYFIGSSCLDRKLFASVGGVSADASHRRHKQSYYMSETRCTVLGVRGLGGVMEWVEGGWGGGGVVLWQNIVEIQTVMFHCSLGERRLFVLECCCGASWAHWCCWFRLLVPPAGSTCWWGGGWFTCFFLRLPLTFSFFFICFFIFFQYRFTCKWDFLFSATLNIEGRST